MNIHYFTPFSLKRDLADEYNRYINLVQNPNDWIILMDGDIMFTRPNWGNEVAEMIKENQDFDLLTILATRIGIVPQRLNNQISPELSLIKLSSMVDAQFDKVEKYRAKQVNVPVGGYFLCFKKKLAMEIPFITSGTGILGVDGEWSKKLIEKGKRIGICQKISVIHYYRLNKDHYWDTSHLMSMKKKYMVTTIDQLIVIPPHFKGIFPNKEEIRIEMKAGIPKEVPEHILSYFTKNRPGIYKMVMLPNEEGGEAIQGPKKKASDIPVLFTTFNRLEFTKQSLKALKASICGEIIVIDNNSSDGTREWLQKQKGIRLILNDENKLVAGAMNQFFELTKDEEWVAKVDNDTIVSKDWLTNLLDHAIESNTDILQAKHSLIKQTTNKNFDQWVKNFPRSGSARLHNFVGGSGVIIRRKVINEQLRTDLGVLRGWTEWQHQHQEVVKGFDIAVEVELLDTKKNGIQYKEYEDYYKFTGRLNGAAKKLDIGCGNWKFEGYETLDNDPIVKPDILADIEDKIPCKDGTYDEIRCHHILEHIDPKNKVKVMAELWRILKSNGILDIELPNFPSAQSVQDPTHFCFWNSEAFRYFLKGDSLYENFKDRYSKYKVPTFKRISEELVSGWIYRTKLQKI